MEENKQLKITFTAFIMIILSVILITAAVTSVIILGSQAQKENEFANQNIVANNEISNEQIVDNNIDKNYVTNHVTNHVSNHVSNEVVNEVYEEEYEEPYREPYVEPAVNAPNIDNTAEFIEYYYNTVSTTNVAFDVDHTTGRILNYDEIMGNLFTKNGKELYENEFQLLYFENNLPYMDAGDDHVDETLIDVKVENIKREENKITATVIKTRAVPPQVFTDETWEMENWERKDFSTEFVMVKENGKWLVDSFVWHD